MNRDGSWPTCLTGKASRRSAHVSQPPMEISRDDAVRLGRSVLDLQNPGSSVGAHVYSISIPEEDRAVRR